MDIAFRPCDLTRRDFENLGLERRVQITVSAHLNLSITTLLDERRQPADLEIATDQDEKVGLLELENEARFRLNEVRILIAFCDRIDRYVIAADLTRNGCEVLRRCDDVQLALSRQRGSRDQKHAIRCCEMEFAVHKNLSSDHH